MNGSLHSVLTLGILVTSHLRCSSRLRCLVAAAGTIRLTGKWPGRTASRPRSSPGRWSFSSVPKRIECEGVIQADGKFKLTTLNPNDGATAGEHVVLVMEVGRKPLGGPDGTNLAPSKIDTRYALSSTSHLAPVKRGVNTITLTVERGSG